MFAQFKLVYNSQYMKAFPDESAINLARQLWFSFLKDFAPATILAATHQAIRDSDFLPTVHSIIRHCENLTHHALPDPWMAYQEACNAGEPKAAQPWSHPIVYHTGNDVGWYFLGTTASDRAFPVFQKHYRGLCERVHQGEVFTVQAPAVPALPDPAKVPLQREENLRRLRETRELLKGSE